MGFIVVVVLSLAVLYGYVGWHLLRLPGLRRRGRGAQAAVAVVLVLAATAVPLARAARTADWNAAAQALAWFGYGALGFVSFAFLGLLLVDLGVGAAALARRVRAGRADDPAAASDRTAPAPADAAGPTRRALLGRSAAYGGVLAGSAVLTGVGVAEARLHLKVERHDVAIANLPPAFDGLRIVQLTDLHVGPTIRRDYVERVLHVAANLPADLIAITGDLVDGSVAGLRPHLAPLGELSAPLGVHFVTGNHEYYSGAEAWVEEVDRMGWNVLLNAGQRLERGGQGLWLGGVTDIRAGRRLDGHRHDVAGAVAGARPDEPKLLLAHQPRSIDDAAAAGVDLMLCGHTHGGQFHPFSVFVAMSQPYLSGLHDHGGTQCYVSRGTGYWGPPLRLGVPTEISLLTLRRARV